ncbi:hypothetical protein COU59_00635 [Candidatus Pacearchaeota archaeon CG10_big_fil_rev_8_21_14_0_10_34_12]|nr:MAG: hypothetical protein COU59_00635 [Candidatus Pacearchaeota archaeon CG10_big_fil_rev_8_21_14_0_10_34_12]
MRFLAEETIAEKRLVKLSVKDKKLIQLLIQNTRMPVTQLAKKVGISKSAIVQKIAHLKKKGVLMNPVTYTSVKISEFSFYACEISTQIGLDYKKITDYLIKIKEVIAVFWYNGPYNLVLALHTEDFQETMDKIQEVVEIKKLRIRKCIGNWLHPPYMFREVSDKKVEFRRIKPRVDDTDKKILKVLDENPLASIVEISTKTRLASQTIKKRMNYLEKEGIINGYEYLPNTWLIGKETISINLIVKGKKETDNLVKYLLSVPEVGNVWEYDDEWNLNFLLWVDNQFEVNKIINYLTKSFKILDYDISVLAAMLGK